MSASSKPALLVRITLLLFRIQQEQISVSKVTKPRSVLCWVARAVSLNWCPYMFGRAGSSLVLGSACSVFELMSIHVWPCWFQSRVWGRAQLCTLLIPDNAQLLFMPLVCIHRSRILLAAEVKNCHHPIIAGQSTLNWRVATSPDSFKILLERNVRVPDWHVNSTQWRAVRMAGVFQESVA
jgi:hypothetical protein